MKQTLSSETARVRRVPFRAITLSLGLSAFAMACSFGEIDSGSPINPIAPPGTGDEQPVDETPDPTVDGDDGDSPFAPEPDPQMVDPDANLDEDMFATTMGRQVKEILETNCGGCHANGVRSGSIDYMLDFGKLVSNKMIVPGNKEDSRIFVRMQQQSMPPAFMRDQRPTFGQIELVGQWIDEMELNDPDDVCTGLEGEFVSLDDQIATMARDMADQDPEDQPFTRYLTISYSNNAGECGRSLQRQRYALFKGINSLSVEPQIGNPEPIDDAKLIYRIDIRDYGWDRPFDLEDDGIVDFDDGWLAILDGVGNYAVEFTGDDADDLKEDAQVNVPFLPVNAFTQFSQINDLYYTLIGARENLFDYELEVLGIDTELEIADNNLMRAGFANSGVSKQDRVLNRFDSGVQAGYSYWISFDFDGGNGNGELNVANESIFQDPLGFQFAGGEAIFNLPNGMQAYYVAAADGSRLGEAPVGVVIDPAQNNGVVVNGASCHSCHNAGMITFTDMVKDYVLANKVQFNNDVFEDVLEQYPEPDVFQAQMDEDSEIHIRATEKAGVPRGTPDPISRVFLDFQLRLTPEVAAGDLQVPVEVLKENAAELDPRLANLGKDDGRVERVLFTQLYLDSLCVFHLSSDNQPVGCP